jgi:hypothetical protein
MSSDGILEAGLEAEGTLGDAAVESSGGSQRQWNSLML